MTESTERVLSSRPLGTTGLNVPCLCVGAAPLGDMQGVFTHVPDEAEAIATAIAALRGPIPFIDTAAGYGDGVSERRLGHAIATIGGVPDGVVIATKVDPIAGATALTGDECRRSLERSRTLLGLAHLPLVYLHDPEYQDVGALMSSGGAIEVLLAEQRAGTIGAIGLAGGTIAVMHEMLDRGVFSTVITHNRYNLLNRSATDLIERAARMGIGVCNAAPFGGGLLGKGPRRESRFAYDDATSETLHRAHACDELARRHGIPLAALALQFSLRNDHITSTILGMGQPERIRQAVELASIPIADDVWQELASLPFADRDLND